MNRIIIAALLLSGLAPVAHAQQGANCTWDSCALRIRAPSFTRGPALVRGAQDEEIVPLGLMQPAIAPYMWSDSSRHYAERYDVLYDRGGILNIAGTATAIIAPIIFPNTSQKIGFTLVGVGISILGGVFTNQANDALNRAVWWHNRELSATRQP
jgi:hypothetical protein